MSRKLVLLADPDEDHRHIFRAILEHHGYEVMESADGDAAVRLAFERRPNLMIVSFPLDTSDRRTVTSVVRTAPETAAIPILAVIAETEPWEAGRARELGATEHCSKPVDPRVVAIQVRRMIGPSVDG